MKLGKLSPLPEHEWDLWCPYDALEIGDVFPILGFIGSCPTCEVGKYPQRFWAKYDGMNGNYHVFLLLHELICQRCGMRITHDVQLMCGVELIDVTTEFQIIAKQK